MTEGGSPAVWIGLYTTTAEDKFWTDGSYVEVSDQNCATKVSYASDNHSAITTSTSDMFISKWSY